MGILDIFYNKPKVPKVPAELFKQADELTAGGFKNLSNSHLKAAMNTNNSAIDVNNKMKEFCDTMQVKLNDHKIAIAEEMAKRGIK